MKLTLVLVCGLAFSAVGYSQVQNTKPVATATNKISFQEYCLKNALTTIQIAPEKAGVKISGELKPVAKENPTYVDYGIELKENEAQYFTVEGKNTVIKVESIFRLRTGYSAM